MSGESRRAAGVDPTAHLAELDGTGLRVAIVAGRFNDAISTVLVGSARQRLLELGVAAEDIDIEWVPGAFETAFAAKLLAETDNIDAVITLGAVIRGETAHFEYVAGASAEGALQVSLATGIPVIFGVLTIETMAQAVERSAADQGNHGATYAETAVEMALLRLRLR